MRSQALMLLYVTLVIVVVEDFRLASRSRVDASLYVLVGGSGLGEGLSVILCVPYWVIKYSRDTFPKQICR